MALAYRSEYSKPVVDAFFAWVDEQRQDPGRLPSDPLTKVLAYAHEREGAPRLIPMGRRNWQFCWSESGARHVGTLQSLLTTCRLQAFDPYTYLVDTLQRIGEHPASDVTPLTPRVWKERFAAEPLVSDLQRHAG